MKIAIRGISGVPGGTKTFPAMNKLQPHPELAEEELCVILVEHTDTAKIRKIFNKINKYAKQTSRSDNMKQVNAALANIGIPVIAGVWRATSPNQNPPVQYCVYSSTTTEASHHDDHVTSFRTYVYLNLWSDIDPTDMAETIRKAMYAYGFIMLEESDKGYNQPAYDTATRQYTVQWTWVWREDAEYGN